MTEIEKISSQIRKLYIKIKQLEEKRRNICPHNNIKRTYFCDDDYVPFSNRNYVIEYKCQDCGLYASSETELFKYKILEQKYNNKD